MSENTCYCYTKSMQKRCDLNKHIHNYIREGLLFRGEVYFTSLDVHVLYKLYLMDMLWLVFNGYVMLWIVFNSVIFIPWYITNHIIPETYNKCTLLQQLSDICNVLFIVICNISYHFNSNPPNNKQQPLIPFTTSNNGDIPYTINIRCHQCHTIDLLDIDK